MSLVLTDDARAFFASELRAAMEKQQFDAGEDSFHYVVELLLRYMETEKFFAKDAEGKLSENLLADLYGEYLQGNEEKKRVALQRLGDISLLITGFFSDSLNRKLVDIDYYTEMGGAAYWHLSNVGNDPHADAYDELSKKFRPFSNALGIVSEKSGVTSNSGVLRIYEKWLTTGDKRLKALLIEHGIFPIEVNRKAHQ